MAQAFTYIDNLPYIDDGEPVDAAVANRVTQQLKNNTDYLLGKLNSIQTNSYEVALSRPVRSDTAVGTPVYYNPTTAQFEPAQAISGQSQVVGVVLNKPTATLADIVISGMATIGITGVLAAGETLTASGYYLSATQAGKLTHTAPTGIQVYVLYADGIGNVIVQPSQVLQGAQGPMGPVGLTGPTGSTGSQGPQGPPGPTPLLFCQLADQIVQNTTVETSLIAANGWGSLLIAANTILAGKTYRVTARGRLSSSGLPTLTLRVKFGTTVIIATNATALIADPVNGGWELRATLTFRAIGTAGAVMGQGMFIYDDQTNSNRPISLVSLSPTTIDTTVQITPDVTVQWGTAGAGNIFTCTNLTVEALN